VSPSQHHQHHRTTGTTSSTAAASSTDAPTGHASPPRTHRKFIEPPTRNMQIAAAMDAGENKSNEMD